MAQPTPTNPIQVLIVDDHPNTAAMLARAVSQMGPHVRAFSASSGREALELTKEQPVDILITDMIMPEMNGLELIEKMAEHPGGRPSYIALITAYEAPGLKVTARRIKINEVISKPVRPERIRQTVENILANWDHTARPQKQEVAHDPFRILIVDDYPDNLTLLSRYLRQEGYEIITAADGMEALEKTREQLPDLLLLDVNMPRKDGFAVVEEIRSDPSVQHIPIIILTAARLDPMDIQAGLNLGADDYVTKPFDRRELMARIRTKLRVKQAEDLMRRRNRELNILPEIGKELSARLDIVELSTILLKRAVETLGALFGYLVIMTADGPYQRTYHVPSTQINEEIPFPQNLFDIVASSHEGFVISETRADPRWKGMPSDQFRSAVVVPLFGRRDLLGVLILVHEQENYFPLEHMFLLQAIVSQAAIAVENASLYSSIAYEQKRLSALLQSTADAILMFDAENCLSMINPAGEHIFANYETHLGLPLPKDSGYDALLNLLELARAKLTPQKGDVSWPDKRVFAALVTPIENGGNVVTLHDITELKRITDELQHLNSELEDRVHKRTEDLLSEINERQRIETALRESEERYILAVNGAKDGLWDWNLKNDSIYYSPRWKSMLGYEEDEIPNRPGEWFLRIHPQDIDDVQEALQKHIVGNAIHFEVEYRMKDKKGESHWMLCRGLAIRDKNGNAVRMAGSQTDITARKIAEERLAHNALHDALTGLPNRTLFSYRLEQRLEYSKRHPESLFAVLFIDMDRFKIINDSLGHAVGDEFLIAVARRIQSCIRAEDTVSRFGGDEFVILLNEMHDASDAIRLCKRIQARLQSTASLGPVHKSTTASIGIAIYNENYSDPQEMLRDSDLAMYRAKSQGGGSYQIFDINMHKKALSLLQLEADIKRANENHEWTVHYQPIVSLTDGRIVGLEALARWNHPRRGLVFPVEFISAAEESGLIKPIGDYVLRESCAQVKAWRDQIDPNLWVSVNLSARQFEDRNLPQIIKHTLAETGLPGDALHIEITESVAMKDLNGNALILRQLDEMGVSLSLDDFGTGYSSLSYLKKFHLKTLKIDRSFIQDITSENDDETITAAIISMGRSLNMRVIVEGVETKEQLAFAKARLCDEMQGNLISPALPPKEVAELLGKPIVMGGMNASR